MAISNRWAIQRVFDVALFDLSTAECWGLLEDLKNTTFTQEGEVVYAMGEVINTL